MATWSATYSGVTYSGTDLEGYGAYDITVSGADGQERTRIANFFVDALADTNRGLYVTSSTSLAVGLGAKSLTMSSEVPFQAGSYVLVSDADNPDTNWMYGPVTSRSGTTLNFTSEVIRGTGTIANWNIQISGVRGADGTLTDIVDDTTPQLGGNLDLNGKIINNIDQLVMFYA